MQYLLDTNICIYLIKKKPEQVLTRLRETEISAVGISTITLSELEYGVEKSQRPAQNRMALTQFAAPLEIVPYDDRAAREYGCLRCALELRGQPIGPLDQLIAAHRVGHQRLAVRDAQAAAAPHPQGQDRRRAVGEATLQMLRGRGEAHVRHELGVAPLAAARIAGQRAGHGEVEHEVAEARVAGL